MEVYGSEPPARRTTDRIKVGIADFAVGDDESQISTSGLGSCVGIALHDERAGVIGLAHAMLPDGEGKDDKAKYVDTAIRSLIAEMEQNGATRRQLRAKLAGGSTMFEFDSTDESVGDRNVTAAHAVLEELGIPIDAEDVGGDHGRSLELEGETGALHVRSASIGEHTL